MDEKLREIEKRYKLPMTGTYNKDVTEDFQYLLSVLSKKEKEIEELKHREEGHCESSRYFQGEAERLEVRVKELEEGINFLPKNKIEDAQRIMRENNFVIDNLDDRWQKLCFTFYADICEMQSKIEELYKLIKKGEGE